MISDEHIDTAIAEGIITAAQAAGLRAIASRAPAPAARFIESDPDAERFRLIGGFNDVFVTIGVGLLVSALVALASALAAGIAFSLIGLAAAWALSEVFARRMRLALPSIALALMFAGSGALALMALATPPFAHPASGPAAAPTPSVMAWFLFGLGLALAAAVHERRFHVPIDAAIVAVGLVSMVFAGLTAFAPELAEHYKPLIFALAGCAVFVVAMIVDAGDPLRLTRRSDVAFWLHLLAAPMIVHAVLPQLMGDAKTLALSGALTILCVFFLLGVVAVVIDRRALLVSGLLYAGIALAYLLSESPARDMQASLTLLALATLVLGLSIGWRPLRAALLPALPLGRLRRFVPPAEPAATAAPAPILKGMRPR